MTVDYLNNCSEGKQTSLFQELFPPNRQNVEHFAKYFTDAGLKELSDFLRVQQSLGTRKELQKELQERLSQECPIKEVKEVLWTSLASGGGGDSFWTSKGEMASTFYSF